MAKEEGLNITVPLPATEQGTLDQLKEMFTTPQTGIGTLMTLLGQGNVFLADKRVPFSNLFTEGGMDFTDAMKLISQGPDDRVYTEKDLGKKIGYGNVVTEEMLGQKKPLTLADISQNIGKFLFEGPATQMERARDEGIGYFDMTPGERFDVASGPLTEAIPGFGFAPDIIRGGINIAQPIGKSILKSIDELISPLNRVEGATNIGETFKVTGEFGGITTNKKGGKSFSDINKLIKNESVRSVLDKVKTGELSRAQAAKILEDSLGVTNLTAFNKNKNALDARASNFSPIYDAYIKTIPQDDIFLTYPDHIFQTTGRKLQSSEIKKVGQLQKLFDRVNSKKFLNTRLPDGTKMEDQPLDYQYYNAYIDSVPRQDHAAYSEFAKKYLNDFYKFKGNKEFNFRKPVKYDEAEGTGYIYDTRVGDKMSKAMSSEFKPLYDTLRKKVQSNVADIPAANEIRVGIPGVLNNHLTRMINRAELEGASFDEIADVINNIDAKAISDIFTRKFLLQNKIRDLKKESLSASLKQTDPQLFPESIPKLKEMNTGLIEISHIEDVVDNWRASFDINNLFLASGKFNRDQRKIDIRLNTILGKLDDLKPDSSEAKELLKEMANLEQSLVDKNLISKIGDRYFGVSKDTDFEKAILDKTQKAVDMTRFYNKGGLATMEHMTRPLDGQR